MRNSMDAESTIIVNQYKSEITQLQQTIFSLRQELAQVGDFRRQLEDAQRLKLKLENELSLAQ